MCEHWRQQKLRTFAELLCKHIALAHLNYTLRDLDTDTDTTDQLAQLWSRTKVS